MRTRTPVSSSLRFLAAHFKRLMPIEIEGLAELSALLTEKTPQAAKRYLSKASDAAVAVLAPALKESAPVEVGVLEESIVSKKTFTNDGDETTMVTDVGPLRSIYYGSFQEWGAPGAGVPALHWMTRAWEFTKGAVLSAFATEALGILHDLENK